MIVTRTARARAAPRAAHGLSRFAGRLYAIGADTQLPSTTVEYLDLSSATPLINLTSANVYTAPPLTVGRGATGAVYAQGWRGGLLSTTRWHARTLMQERSTCSGGNPAAALALTRSRFSTSMVEPRRGWPVLRSRSSPSTPLLRTPVPKVLTRPATARTVSAT
jgi:hypothetical protein